VDIGVFGAGAIGGYLGVRLSAAGERVRLLGRPRLVEVADRLTAVDHAGVEARGGDLSVSDDPESLRGVDVCLVTVKSQDTPAVAGALQPLLRPDALVVSFQNGLHNARVLDAALDATAVQGVVSYNVFRDGPARFVQATVGKLIVGAAPAATTRLGRLADALRRAGELVELRGDIDGVVAGKLLLNLNNGVCAATGLTIVASIRDRDARWCFAECMAEGLRVFAAAGLRPVSPLALPLVALPPALKLPDRVVLSIAKGLVDAHPSAKSSTLQDLERGRATEIADLNGAIVELARAHRVPCPANRAVVDVIRRHEAAVAEDEKPVWITPRALRDVIERR